MGLHRNYDLFSVAAHNDGIMYDLWEALDIIMAEDAQGYMRHLGYF